MMITQYERYLARELAEAIGRPEFVDRDSKVLAVVLWSHRQLPADSADTRDSYAIPCGKVYDNTDSDNVIRCVLPRGHLVVGGEFSHQTSDGVRFG